MFFIARLMRGSAEPLTSGFSLLQARATASMAARVSIVSYTPLLLSESDGAYSVNDL